MVKRVKKMGPWDLPDYKKEIKGYTTNSYNS